MKLIDPKECPCDGCPAKPCGHPARCVKFAVWLNKTVEVQPVAESDCESCRQKKTCLAFSATIRRTNCPLWRGKV